MTTLTIGTINLRNRVDRWRERRHVLVSALLESTPDLISLQEISFPIRQGQWLCEQLNARLATTASPPYTLVQKRKAHPLHGYLEGIGILSRLPVLSHDSVNLGYGGRVALRASIELTSGHTLDFVATHLHHPARDREARLEQAMALVGWLQGTGRAPYQVVGGDFNEIPDGPAIMYMKQSYLSAYEVANGFEPVATFPTALAPPGNGWTGCLDYLFVTSNIEVCTAQIFCDRPSTEDDTLYPSDHVGVLASLKVTLK